MTTGLEADRIEAVRLRLKRDYIYYGENAVKIIDKRGRLTTLRFTRAQKRLLRALMRQRDAGLPQRAMALKARQVGVSTACQSVMSQRTTQEENHLALVLAQDRKTAGKLFKMGETAWANLPAEIKPTIARKADTEDRKYMLFGNPSSSLRRAGLFGLNSSMEISTAAGLAGRGLTPRTLHVSEYAWWEKGEAILGVINGVPDDEDSLIVKESTARGHNHFKDEWDIPEGEDGYHKFFSPWFEEETYRRPFMAVGDRIEFEASIGRHPRYSGEPGYEEKLRELIRESYLAWHAEDPYPWLTSPEALETRVLEHLHWRRWAIASKCQGKIDRFMQEYPSTPEEAFLATGQRVFDAQLVQAVLKRTEKTDPSSPNLETPGPVPGIFRVTETRKARDRAKNIIEVPTAVEWWPIARGLQPGDVDCLIWRLWAAPQKRHEREDGTVIPDGQYVVFCDPASGETDEKGTTHAQHAVEIIDHRTRKQVAEWVGQIDPDIVALEMLKAALYFNKAWAAPERTGGYGLSIGRKLAIDYRYSRTYTEKSKDKRIENQSERIGWSTDSVSKPLMEAEGIELLRLEKDGIRSSVIPRQMLTFVRNDRGRSGPEPGHRSDALMAWLGAQMMARMIPVRPDRGAESALKRPAKKRRPKRRKTGY